VAGYVRRSSIMQGDNLSSDAQKHKIQEACAQQGLPAPIFYEDDLLSAHTDQVAKRPAFRHRLDDVEAGLVQMVVVHSFDRWARNVMITLQMFRILGNQRVPFPSLTDPIDYSTPQGILNLLLLQHSRSISRRWRPSTRAKGKKSGLFRGC
jgi:site-specific DNA recombinase